MRSNSLDQSLPIVGVLFALCVTFWAENLIGFSRGGVIWPLPVSTSPASQLPQEKEHDAKAERDEQDAHGSDDDKKSATKKQESQTRAVSFCSGILFLVDLLCILWWFGKYLHPVQPSPTLWRHLVDFSIWGLLAMGSQSWDKPRVFIWATVPASCLLMIRFLMVYRAGDSTDTDKKIILGVGIALGVATLVAFVAILSVIVGFDVLRKDDNFDMYLLPALPGVLALIGIVVTILFRHKITIAANIHECKRHRFESMEIHWPESLRFEGRRRATPDELLEAADGKVRRHNPQDDIRSQTSTGLQVFHDLFKPSGGGLSHERLRSRVHAEADLVVQSYILAVASRCPEDVPEIKRKAFIVGLSHWLDDLMDGRRETHVIRVLRSKEGFDFRVSGGAFDGSRTQKELFTKLYRNEICRYTDGAFYSALVAKIEGYAVRVGGNKEFMYFGLNRVAAGAAMFSPKISDAVRMKLCECHNQALLALIGTKNKWQEDIRALLVEMDGEDGSPGRILLGLTTKTAQELAMSSEGAEIDWALSVLYSVLYAPLLYFHDADDELECGEMLPLDKFDVDYDQVTDWLSEVRALCEDANDRRVKQRFEQLAMAFRCFAPRLPESVRERLEHIYVTPPNIPKPSIAISRSRAPASGGEDSQAEQSPSSAGA